MTFKKLIKIKNILIKIKEIVIIQKLEKDLFHLYLINKSENMIFL